MILFFTELAESHPLLGHGPIKVSLRAARMHLKLQKGSTVDVVYPLPWLLTHLPVAVPFTQPEESLAAWMDFYIDTFTLAEENPGRVRLTPLDVFVKQKVPVPLADSLEAYLLEQTNPEAFDLLENLELNAELNGRREAQTRNPTGLMPQTVAQQVSKLLRVQQENVEELMKLRALVDKFEKDNSLLKTNALNYESANSPDLRVKCEDLEDENKIILEQLFKVQDEFEKVYRSVQALEKTNQELLQRLKESEQHKNILEQKLTESREVGVHDEQSDVIETTKDLKAENELLVRQLHLVQEEFERQYLELKSYKQESQQSAVTIKLVHEYLRKQLVGQLA